MTLEYWLHKYIDTPKDQNINFNLGWQYEQHGQLASACSFYLRSIEYGNDDTLRYEAMLRMSLCFEQQGNRVFTIKGILLRAISLQPTRPEAYFLLARIYERSRDWQESYTMSILGQRLETTSTPLRTDVEYPGVLGFKFEQAVTAWWIGLWNESISLFKELENEDMPEMYKTAIQNNLNTLKTK
jgi:tetratricopeptide (TPR) repeat protein